MPDNERTGLGPLIAPFRGVSKTPYQHAADWRAKTGGRVIGCVPMYVPDEVIHAAGMLPIQLLGGEETITLANRYVQPYISCGVVRSTLDLALKGKLGFLDGAVFPDICEPPERIADIWRAQVPLPFHHNYMLPLNLTSPGAPSNLIRRIRRLADALTELGGTITDAGLRRSIAIYNENRRLLARLYELRLLSAFPLKASEVSDIVLASMLMLKEEHTKLLVPLLSALEAGTHESDASAPARIVLCGYTCDRPENSVLDFVEGLGTRVVDDELFVGRRYVAGLTAETGDPYEALAQRHIDFLPCVTKRTAKSWSEQVVSMALAAKADGVLVVALKYCDPVALEYPNLKRSLDNAGIPHLAIEVEERGSGTGMIRTRLQAFVEMISARKEED